MGMDVYGNAPTQKEGEYFRNNIWWWHPLADYIELVAPDEAAACEHWHSNDGDGLDTGIGAADLMDRLGAVDARDAPVTRDILQAIADMQGERS